MGFPPILVWAAIGALIVSDIVCVAAAIFAWRAAWPIGLRRVASNLRERVEACESDWEHTRGQLAVRVEQLEELEESVERKRARVAARESWDKRSAAAPGALPPTPSKDELRRIARARGFNV